MSTINIDLAADTILNVMIGQQDENEVREVVFDFSGWYTTYGSGTISLAIQRPKDEWPYEGTLTVDSTNHKATWEISDTDTAYAGTGQIQLSYKVGDAKKKSVVYRFTCHKSLGALGSVVTPVQIQTFIDEVEEALQTMDGKLDDMEDEITDVKSDLDNNVNDLKSAISGFEGNTETILNTSALDWKLGTLDTHTGADVQSNTRISTGGFIDITTCASITAWADTDYKVRVLFFDANDSVVNTYPDANNTWIVDSTTWNEWSDAVKIKLVASDSSDGSASISYATHVHLTYVSKMVKTVNELADAIITTGLELTDAMGWEQGGLDTTYGTEFDSNKRIRTGFIDATKLSEFVVNVNSTDFRIAIYKYDNAKAFIGYTAWHYYKYLINEPTGFYRLVLAYASDTPLTPTEASTVSTSGKVLAQEELKDAGLLNQNVKMLSLSTAFDLFSIVKWERGSIKTEDGTNIAATNRLRSVGYLDLSGYDAIKITVDTGYKYAVYFYDSSMNFLTSLYSPGVWNTLGHIYNVSNTALKYLRICIANITDTDSEYDMFKHLHSYSINRFQQSNVKYLALEDSSICVMSYNAQFFRGRNANHEMIKELIDKYMPDVIGVTEYINFADNINIHRTLFSEYSYSQLQLDIPAGNAIYTKRQQSDGSNVQFSSNNPSGETRGYNKTHIYIGGVKVALYNTHLEILPTLSDSRTYRAAQASQLLADAETEEYAIIMGDFNTGDCLNTNGLDYIDVIKPFIDAGYHSANCSTQHGFIKTYYSAPNVEDSTTAWCLDQIITTPNIDILAVNVDKSKLAEISNENIDHLPVIAYLHIN